MGRPDAGMQDKERTCGGVGKRNRRRTKAGLRGLYIMFVGTDYISLQDVTTRDEAAVAQLVPCVLGC